MTPNLIACRTLDIQRDINQALEHTIIVRSRMLDALGLISTIKADIRCNSYLDNSAEKLFSAKRFLFLAEEQLASAVHFAADFRRQYDEGLITLAKAKDEATETTKEVASDEDAKEAVI